MAKRQLKVNQHYDDEANVLYIAFGSDEPTYTENIDDIFMLEIGWFSRLPQGIRVVLPQGKKLKTVEMTLVINQMKKKVRNLMKSRQMLTTQQEPAFYNFCEQLPTIFAKNKIMQEA